MSPDPIPFPGGRAPEQPAQPAAPENPLAAMAKRWRQQHDGSGVANPVREQCADELEKFLATQNVALPPSLVERLSLAVMGGYLSLVECQHIVSAVSFVAAFSGSKNILVLGELRELDDNATRQSGGQLRTVWFANAMTQDAMRYMAVQAKLRAAQHKNGRHP